MQAEPLRRPVHPLRARPVQAGAVRRQRQMPRRGYVKIHATLGHIFESRNLPAIFLTITYLLFSQVTARSASVRPGGSATRSTAASTTPASRDGPAHPTPTAAPRDRGPSARAGKYRVQAQSVIVTVLGRRKGVTVSECHFNSRFAVQSPE